MSGRYADDSAALAEVMRDVRPVRREVDPDAAYDRMGEQPVLCRDCRHARVGTFIRCWHPNNVRADLVAGGMRPVQTAEWLREHDCGFEANWFQGKP